MSIIFLIFYLHHIGENLVQTLLRYVLYAPVEVVCMFFLSHNMYTTLYTLIPLRNLSSLDYALELIFLLNVIC